MSFARRAQRVRGRLADRILRARFAAARGRRRELIEAYLRGHAVRKLQLGTGRNVLPGWLNTDVFDVERSGEIAYLDARAPFPLPDATFDFVFSEHMLEHLSYADGLRCLQECLRILKPGGRIRIATPSLDRLVSLFATNRSEVEERYLRWAVDTWVPDTGAHLPGFVLNNFLRDWGHRFVYDRQTLAHALTTAGFVDVREFSVGRSETPELAGLEAHGKAIPPEFNELETIVLEARRP
jgi:predicted SAM-dependent methyltransferase